MATPRVALRSLQREILHVHACHLNCFRRRKTSNRLFPAIEESHHAAMHRLVELDAYVFAFHACGNLSYARLVCRCYHTNQNHSSLDHRGPILADSEPRLRLLSIACECLEFRLTSPFVFLYYWPTQ